jgi:hypothetical protein
MHLWLARDFDGNKGIHLLLSNILTFRGTCSTEAIKRGAVNNKPDFFKHLLVQNKNTKQI